MINGQLKADSGSIVLDGAPLTGLKPREIWHRGVGRTFQIAETFASLTAVENVQMALLSAAGRTFDLWRRASRFQRDEALALLHSVGMDARPSGPAACWPMATSSGWNWPSPWPTSRGLLLMDEPTAGMAPRERNELMALTKRLVVERGMAVLFTEHSMDVVFAHADRVIVLARGRLIAEGPPDAIRDHPKVQEVYFGSGKTFGKKPGVSA